MKRELELKKVIKPLVEEMGFEFVGMELFLQGRYTMLRIYVDREQAVALDDCAVISQQLSDVLDEENLIAGQYNLEVSSPGLDRPLFNIGHFKRFIRKKVSVRLQMPVVGKKQFNGIIKAVKQDQIVFLVDDQELVVPFDLITKANLIYGDLEKQKK